MAIQPFYSAQTREQFLADAKAALEAEEAAKQEDTGMGEG